MNKTIYISGPITDPTTGKPRKGWQEDFLDAEARLRRIGFSVLNPIDIAREVEENFAWKWEYTPHHCTCDGAIRPDRSDYILACLQRMRMNHELGRLHGMFLIGGSEECRESHGVQMELHMAELLGIPVFAECKADCEIWTDILHMKSYKTIEEFLNEA